MSSTPARSAIRFGTSGWRAILAEDFTFENVTRAVDAIARYLQRHGSGAGVLVGYDTRFFSDRFAEFTARRLSRWGIRALLSQEAVPTPALAYAVISRKMDGAINFTASHNPPEYNGIKFSGSDGAPALPEVTSQIEALLDADSSPSHAEQLPERVDLRPPYLERLKQLVDLPAIRRAGIAVGFDPLWGAARNYTDALLREAGVPVVSVHGERDVLFGGQAPEPEEHNTRALAALMKERGARVGLVTDGDADRFGILDEDGALLQPNYVLALLLDYLVESRGWTNGVGKSVATTNLLNALAQHYGMPLHETPVGFKYLGELIKNDQAVLVGEESAGLSVRHHVPEKDGVLAGLLIAEMCAMRGASLKEQLRQLFDKVGSYYPSRENFRLTGEQRLRLSEKLEQSPTRLGGRAVRQVVRTDGLKLILDDGSWVLFRPSGTEPVVRLYAETRREEELPELVKAAREYLLSPQDVHA